MAQGTVGWVQVDTDDPESAKRFYGELFGWTFAADANSGGKYHLATRAGEHAPHGGILDTGGDSPNQATFSVEVPDVPAAIAATEKLGGKVVAGPTTLPTGLVTADLVDPAGNPVGIFAPPA
jgi:predicted enzyme related to lactoylglutathione lyase